MFALKTAKVIGTPSGLAWSQVHGFKVEGEKLKKRGRLLVVLTLKEAGQGIEAVVAGREILARINEEYYGNLEGTPFEKLKAVLKKLNKEFGNLELVAAVFYQRVGYFGVLGGGKIVVKRGSVIQRVLELQLDRKLGNAEALNPEPEQGSVQGAETLRVKIASGFVQEGDIFLLGSKKFFEEVAEGTWRAALGTGEPEEMVEILAPIVAGREEIGGAAVGIVKVGNGKWPAHFESRPLASDFVDRRSRAGNESGGEVEGVKLRGLFGKLLRSRPVFVKSRMRQQERKKTLLTVAVILIFLLLTSVVLGIRKRRAEQKRARTEEIITQVESKLEEARGLVTLKPSEAKKTLEEAQKLFDESSEFEALRKEIEVELAKVVREFRLAEVPVFMDLSLVKEDAKGNDLALFRNNLVVLDQEGKRLIGIDLEKKSSKILAGGEDLEGASQVTIWNDKVYVLAEKGILESQYPVSSIQYPVSRDEKWGQIIDLDTWMSNLYLLDKDKDTIWRYLVIEGGFGGAQNWIKGSAPDLSKATSFAIDGSIWITQQSLSAPLPAGEAGILKFTSGSQEAFSLVGLEKPLASPERIYTDDIANNLYILDKGNYRVVVLDKEGNYQASYLWAGIGEVEDMVVSEEVKKIFLLAGSKIYEIEIR